MRRNLNLGCCLGLLTTGILCGCEGRPNLIPNSDSTMNRTSTQFAADAAKRFPYPATTAKGGVADGRAEVDLMVGRIQILNSSTDDWNDIDIWVNQSYVCHVPSIAKGKQKVESVDFTMLYNDQGHYFSTNNGKTPAKTIEMKWNGKLYSLKTTMAE